MQAFGYPVSIMAVTQGQLFSANAGRLAQVMNAGLWQLQDGHVDHLNEG